MGKEQTFRQIPCEKSAVQWTCLWWYRWGQLQSDCERNRRINFWKLFQKWLQDLLQVTRSFTESIIPVQNTAVSPWGVIHPLTVRHPAEAPESKACLLLSFEWNVIYNSSLQKRRKTLHRMNQIVRQLNSLKLLTSLYREAYKFYSLCLFASIHWLNVGWHRALMSRTAEAEVHTIHLTLELDLDFATRAIPKDLILEVQLFLSSPPLSERYCSQWSVSPEHVFQRRNT